MKLVTLTATLLAGSLSLAAAPRPSALAPVPEVPNRSPEQLLATATHVVVGDVRAVYSFQETDGGWRTTRYVAELGVTSIEKGEGIALDRPLYVRYFHRDWVSRRMQPADTNGHRGLPKVGARVRAYLARNASDGFDRKNDDGGYNLVFPNGCATLEREPEERR